MATYTIDTHATIRELENAGMDSRQAEVVVAAIGRSDAELPTKSDLKAEITAVRSAIDKLEASTRADLKAEITAVRSAIDKLETSTRADLKAEITAVGSAIDKLETSTRAEIASLKADLKIIKYFFGPAIIILLLKIAFF